MKLAEVFGKEVRRIREQLELTQEELADRAKLHRTYVSLIERGQRMPTLDVAFRLAQGLGTSPSELVRKAERAYLNGSD